MYKRQVLQPTHVIAGIENQKMEEDAGAFTHVFQQIAFGRPLLSALEDLTKVAGILACLLYTSNTTASFSVVFGTIVHGCSHAPVSKLIMN